MKKKYTVTDGKMVLTLQENEDGSLLVRSPVEPALITQASNIREAFEMARDAQELILKSRNDPDRWDKSRRRGVRKSA